MQQFLFLHNTFSPTIKEKKLQGILKCKNTVLRDRASIKPNSDIGGMLELADQEWKITMSNMLRALMDKVDTMQKKIGNVNREIEILIKIQKKGCLGGAVA